MTKPHLLENQIDYQNLDLSTCASQVDLAQMAEIKELLRSIEEGADVFVDGTLTRHEFDLYCSKFSFFQTWSELQNSIRLFMDTANNCDEEPALPTAPENNPIATSDSPQLSAELLPLATTIADAYYELALAHGQTDYTYAKEKLFEAINLYSQIGHVEKMEAPLSLLYELAGDNNDRTTQLLVIGLEALAEGDIDRAWSNFQEIQNESELADTLLKQIDATRKMAKLGPLYTLLFTMYQEGVETIVHMPSNRFLVLFGVKEGFDERCAQADQFLAKWLELMASGKYRSTEKILEILKTDDNPVIQKGYAHFMDVLGMTVSSAESTVARLMVLENEEETVRAAGMLEIAELDFLVNGENYQSALAIAEIFSGAEDKTIRARAQELTERVPKDARFDALRPSPLDLALMVVPLGIGRFAGKLARIQAISRFGRGSFKMRMLAGGVELAAEVPAFVLSSTLLTSLAYGYEGMWSADSLGKQMGTAFLEFGFLKIFSSGLTPLRQSMGSVRMLRERGSVPIRDVSTGAAVMPLNLGGRISFGVATNIAAVGGLMVGDDLSRYLGFQDSGEQLSFVTRLLEEELMLLQLTLGTKLMSRATGGRIEARLRELEIQESQVELNRLLDALGLKKTTQGREIFARYALRRHAEGNLPSSLMEKIGDLVRTLGDPRTSKEAREAINEVCRDNRLEFAFDESGNLLLGVEWQSTPSKTILTPALATATAGEALATPHVEGEHVPDHVLLAQGRFLGSVRDGLGIGRLTVKDFERLEENDYFTLDAQFNKVAPRSTKACYQVGKKDGQFILIFVNGPGFILGRGTQGYRVTVQGTKTILQPGDRLFVLDAKSRPIKDDAFLVPETAVKKKADIETEASEPVRDTARRTISPRSYQERRDRVQVVQLERGVALVIDGETGSMTYNFGPFESSALSDVGVGRAENQDGLSIIQFGETYYTLSIDGMGGHANGRQAMKIALAVISGALGQGQTPVEAFEQAYQRLNSTFPFSETRGDRSPGAALNLTRYEPSATGYTAQFFTIGDVRAVVVRNGEVFDRTKEQTIYQGLVDRGLPPEQAARIAGGDRLTNCLRSDSQDGFGGIARGFNPTELGRTTMENRMEIPLQEGDLIIQASDGLWKVMTPEEAAALIRGLSPEAATTLLLEEAKRRMADDAMGQDNINILVTRVWAPKAYGGKPVLGDPRRGTIVTGVNGEFAERGGHGHLESFALSDVARPKGIRYPVDRSGRAIIDTRVESNSNYVNEDGVGFVRVFAADGSEHNYTISVDGMGGQGGGDRAMQIALEVLARELSYGHSPHEAFSAVVDAYQAEAASNPQFSQNSGVCLTLGHFKTNPSGETQATFYNFGDARSVLFRPAAAGGVVEVATRDQSKINYQLSSGVLKQSDVTPELIHSEGHIVANALMARSDPTSYWTAPNRDVVLRPGDRIVQASDGLWDFMSHEEVYAILRQHDNPEAATRALREEVLRRMDKIIGEGDNGDNLNIIVTFIFS